MSELTEISRVAGEAEGSAEKGPKKTVNQLKIWIGASATLALVLIVVLVVSLSGSDDDKYYERKSCEEGASSPIKANACLRLNCTFDVSSCTSTCPFGYENDGLCEVGCECALEGTFQGDVYFDQDEVQSMAEEYGYTDPESDFAVFSGSAQSGKLWDQYADGGRIKIFYEFDESFQQESMMRARQAFRLFSENTCIDFLERKIEEIPFVRVVWETACRSKIGYKPSSVWNGQKVSVGDSCGPVGVFVHEFMHLLGFHHEQTRPDRDAYVRIFEENINGKKGRNQYRKMSRNEIQAVYTQYDLKSTLHYGSDDYATKDGPAMLSRKGEFIKNNDAPTQLDWDELNMLYDCLERTTEGHWTSWTEWSLCDKTCGFGYSSRYRRCEDREGVLVTGCEGTNMESRPCEENLDCHTMLPSGQWGEWALVTECSKTCGDGKEMYERKCTPERSRCEGKHYVFRDCFKETCAFGDLQMLEIQPSWTEWMVSGKCTLTCGGGKKKFFRKCFKGMFLSNCKRHNGQLSTMEMDYRDCNTSPCPEKTYVPIKWEWGLWTSCSESCDGLRTRKQTCIADECGYLEIQSQSCNRGVCQKHEEQMFHRETTVTTDSLCEDQVGTTWHFADFNGDKRTDVLCSRAGDIYKLGHADASGQPSHMAWKGKLEGCEGLKLMLGDFNGDGRSDLLCRDNEKRRLVIKHATQEGLFEKKVVEAGPFCTESEATLVVLDANQDGRADLLCYSSEKHFELRLNALGRRK